MDSNTPNESGKGVVFSDLETKAHLTAIIDNAPGYVYSIDREYRLITISAPLKEVAKEQFGLNLQPGDSPFKFFENILPELVAEWKEIYARAFAGEKLDFVKEFDLQQKSFWHFSFNPIRQENKIVGLACFVSDVTQQKVNEKKLKQSEEHYRMVSQNPLVGIAWGNAKGIMTHANQAFFDLLEGTCEQLIGLNPAEITHPDDLAAAIPYFKQLMNGEITHYRIEKRYITLKKNIKWVELDINSVKDEKGKIQHVVAVVKDITEKREAQESLLKAEMNLRHILDSTDMAAGLLDKEFNILVANRLANEWALSEMGLVLTEGKNFFENFPATYKPVALSVMQNVLHGTPYQYEAKYTKRDKSVRWYRVKLTPIAEKGKHIMGLCITAEDTTQERNTEAEIKSLNDSLERKVQDRPRELEEANKELEAFTYSVSHDLLSPLRNIDSFIDILVEDYKNILDAEGQQTLSVIKRNSTLMGRLINDLLGFARIGKLQLVKQMVSMDGVVNDVKDELRFMTNKLADKIIVKDLNPAYCDPQLIKQVWVNLISNAIKYSSTTENPQVEIGSLEENGEIVYYIKDNGVGFDTKLADKLFGVFHRLHKNSDFEGTGVGLAIAHRIITKHGGRIWADSKVNEGATFYFTL